MSEGIGQEFMRMTRYQYLGESDQRRGVPQPPLELGYDDGSVLIGLPAPEDIQVRAVGLREAIEGRVSVRRYAAQPLTLAELSYLLWCSLGVRAVEGRRATWRNVPSAGARHALETWLLVNRVEDLQPGLYRFLAVEHKLLRVSVRRGIADDITKACWGQQMVRQSAVTFLWVAVPYRMTWRYGERGYRYLLLDAGHVCQNLYLGAVSLGSGVCAIGAFLDEDLNRLLKLDGEEQFVIYLATVGKQQ